MADIKNYKFTADTYPDVVTVFNRLAVFYRRKPHDAGKYFIEEAGQAMLDFPELYDDFIAKVNLQRKTEAQSAIAG